MKANTRTFKSTLLCLVLLLAITMPVLAADPVPSPTAENRAPRVEDLELSTFRDVAVSGTLLALDPEGDLLEFQIVRSPRRGDLELDQSTGRFTYTPHEGRRGRDVFTYVAIDALGNISSEATVRLRIERQSRQVYYTDMDGHQAQLAAIELSERDIFVGEQIGGRHFFNPNNPVRRGEFLAMVLRASEADILTGIVRTGFSDDSEIADWLKPYVSTAVLGGVVQGLHQNGSLVFAPHDYISVSEASVILNNVLGLYDVPVMSYSGGIYAAPVWARQATSNLRAESIISSDYPGVYQSTLNRADAAQMLQGAVALLEGRSVQSSSLLNWAN